MPRWGVFPQQRKEPGAARRNPSANLAFGSSSARSSSALLFDDRIFAARKPRLSNRQHLEEQQAAEMKRESSPIVSILYPEKYGFSFDYKGKEQIEGKDYLWDLNYPKVLNIGTYHPSVPESVRNEAAALLEQVKSGAVTP